MKSIGVCMCLAVLLTTCTNIYAAALTDFSEAQLAVYRPPDEEAPVRRREAGLAEGDMNTTVRSAARGASRGTARGAARGIVRGVTRGIVRGATRGIVRGASRGILRAMSRGASRGAARGIVRGASRGIVRGAETDILPAELLPPPRRMEPLAPQPTGYTAYAQPVLYFYVSDASSDPIHFSLTREDEIDPVLEVELPIDKETGRIEAGIHSIALADYDVVLEAGFEYEWFVAIVFDWTERSSDFLASATLEYSPHLLNGDNPSQGQGTQYAHYGQKGLWYDALQVLNGLIADEPSNPLYRAQRKAWLTQVKLPSAAAYETQRLGRQRVNEGPHAL